VLSGGRIDRLSSRQNAWKYVDGPPVHLVPNPHITIVCDLDSVVHNPQTNILTGTWLDGMAFSIQLIDVEGYSPAIENIQFIPEPSTLLLMALGVVSFLHRR
ncbi:MAG TPA: PEP-CTERM sorting domain-containing protein, partial [Anaerohalosphaeraceae bacterium]|nr:PEP-CTERM sorting domain-containing protein [Anaerohalosphaeraceae bacterium]HRT51485.1 PEP-CTERM sorting domain-containing protein [Anaerohalosphaeraceae bacterium]